ncbi:hypothetical protein HID58_068312 [Brassica napus]|uniref:Uncharacterized protein n=1 Tax=Brassica napus TaxID=3708 RepID=A0ABQ7ZLB6_BRANA|nr:hypothetical protein HID58_068312 [Brassica napus]
MNYCNAGGERYWGNKILPELEEFSSLFYISIVLVDAFPREEGVCQSLMCRTNRKDMIGSASVQH